MFLKIGHRGAKAYEVENTIESFKRAIELGANAVELDVRKTKDGNLAVIHDDNLKRVFGRDVPVSQATLRELKQLTGNKLPELGEALQSIQRKVEKILIELKEVGDEREVLAIIRKKKLRDRVIIVSFHEDTLWEVRGLDKKIETGLIYSKHKNPIAAALKLDAQYLVAHYRATGAKSIEDAHKDRLKVIVWTINTKRGAKAYREKDVDGIATDKPDIFSPAEP